MQRALQEIDSLDSLILALKSASDEERLALIRNSSVALADLTAYHYSSEKSYGRNLIFNCDEFEVILMCWGAGHHSAPHDHSDSLCVMKCLSGELQEQRFVKRTDSTNTQSIVATELRSLRENEATSITDSEGLHSLMNNSQDSACSLHFYFPPIHQSAIYDLATSSSTYVSSKFTSEYGVKL